MSRKLRIANALMDLADLRANESYRDMQRGDEIRASFTKAERDYGMAWFGIIADHELTGWGLDGRWRRMNREAASLMLSNRRGDL